MCSQLPLNPVRDDQTRYAIDGPLGVAVEVQPFRQLDLRNQKEDRRGDLIATGLGARGHRLTAFIDASTIGDEQARTPATIDEAQA